MFVTGLDRVLRNAGVEFEGTDGWETRSLNREGLSNSIKAVMYHDTQTADSAFRSGGNFPTLNYVINGLGYPLYNILIGRDGSARIIAAGSAAHAGKGTGGGMTRDNGNREALAVSADANESEFPITEAQLDSMARIGKALDDDWSGNLVHIMHGEWSDMRRDPTEIPGGWDALREAISKGSWSGGAAKPSGGGSSGSSDASGSSSKTTAVLAQEVIDGKHGSGEARKRALGSRYDAVQAEVNRRLGGGGSSGGGGGKSTAQLAREVIDGKHGSGEARKRALGSRYSAVQAEVNRQLGGGGGGGKSTAQLAREVIDGKHGSGAARRRALGSRYDAVQAEVNRRLGGGGGGGKSTAQLAQEVIDGKHGSGAARKRALGSRYDAVQAEVNRRLS